MELIGLNRFMSQDLDTKGGVWGGADYAGSQWADGVQLSIMDLIGAAGFVSYIWSTKGGVCETKRPYTYV